MLPRVPGIAIGPCLTLLILAGCTSPPVDDGRREATVPAVPAFVPRPPQARAPLRATWVFHATDEECIATAATTGVTLVVTVRRNESIRLALSHFSLAVRGTAVIPLHFSGSAGTWQLGARVAAPHQITADLGGDDMALSQVLVLLSGGTLTVGTGPHAISSLLIAPSDAEGRRWFECARRQVS